MINDQKKFLRIFSIIILIVLHFSLSCSTVPEQIDQTIKYTGQFSLFLNGPERSSLDLSFTLNAVTIISDDGRSIELMNVPAGIHSLSMISTQVLLAEMDLPIGKYHKIKMLVSDVRVKKKNRTAQLALPPDGIEIPINVTIRRKTNSSLFLHWSADSSVTDKYLFTPYFTVQQRLPELSSLLIYVTNELSNNVSVINRDTGEVVTHIMVGKNPRGIASSLSKERSKIYVANSGSDSISVIDQSTNKSENEIPVRFGEEPEGIAVVQVTRGEELIFVTNFRTDSVSVFDGITFEEIEKIDVERAPVAIAADPPVDELIGSRSLAFEDISTLRSFRERFLNVYVANQNSNSVSVIRIDIRTKKSVEVATLAVDWNPKALFIDYPQGKVYVANYGSNKLSVIDIIQLIKGNESGAVSVINNVGHNMIGVISDASFDRLYLLKENPGQMIIMKPFGMGFESLETIMPPIMGSIPLGISPRSFLIDPEKRLIYVVNRGSNTISVIDKTSQRKIQEIEVGKMPYGITLISK